MIPKKHWNTSCLKKVNYVTCQLVSLFCTDDAKSFNTHGTPDIWRMFLVGRQAPDPDCKCQVVFYLCFLPYFSFPFYHLSGNGFCFKPEKLYTNQTQQCLGFVIFMHA
jgi:hypothetical protein